MTLTGSLWSYMKYSSVITGAVYGDAPKEQMRKGCLLQRDCPDGAWIQAILNGGCIHATV